MNLLYRHFTYFFNQLFGGEINALFLWENEGWFSSCNFFTLQFVELECFEPHPPKE